MSQHYNVIKAGATRQGKTLSAAVDAVNSPNEAVVAFDPHKQSFCQALVTHVAGNVLYEQRPDGAGIRASHAVHGPGSARSRTAKSAASGIVLRNSIEASGYGGPRRRTTHGGVDNRGDSALPSSEKSGRKADESRGLAICIQSFDSGI